MAGDDMLVINTSTGERVKGVEILNPLQSIECAVAFQVRDMCIDRRDAWIYAIVFGLDEEHFDGEPSALDEVRRKHNWTDADIQRVKKLHENYKLLSEAFDKGNSADVVPWDWLKQYADGKRCNFASDFVYEAEKAYKEKT